MLYYGFLSPQYHDDFATEVMGKHNILPTATNPISIIGFTVLYLLDIVTPATSRIATSAVV